MVTSGGLSTLLITNFGEKKGAGCRNTKTRGSMLDQTLSQPHFPWLGYHVCTDLLLHRRGQHLRRLLSGPGRPFQKKTHGPQPAREVLSCVNDAVLSSGSNAAWNGCHCCVCSCRSVGNYTWIQSNYAETCTPV